MNYSMMSTRSVKSPPVVRSKQLEDFRSIVSQSFVPLDIQELNARPFSAEVSSVAARNVTFTKVRASPHLVERNPKTIADGGSGYYKVSLLLSGSSILVQDNKELVMHPGELSIYDTSRPYSLLFDNHFQNLVMMFPKESLRLSASYTEQLTATSFTHEHPILSGITREFLAQFPTHLQSLSAHTRSQLARASVELVSTLCSGLLDSGKANDDPNRLMLQSLIQYIEDHLSDSELSPTTIAAAHYISIRHLHSLFGQTQNTVSGWIRELRLDRCFQDLQNPLLSNCTVLAVATSWGFTDAAHFSRVFKAKFGMSPRQLRNDVRPEYRS